MDKLDLSLKIIFSLIGGLGIFLLGMKNMSEGMQAIAGARLRKLISAVTNNRFLACGVGTLITCIIQSSSVTTVMVVGFVNGGFMTLTQAIGVIIGANIGTTITGWILALKIAKYGLPILGIAAFVYLFSKNERRRYVAMAIMGVGMVFFGLQTMSSGFKVPEVKAILESVFSKMSGDQYSGILICALVGCVATMIVQSSSASLGVTVALASSEVITFNTAASLILGLNIGTTITAWLASLGATTNAKRAAYAHIFFNIIGTVWLFPIFPVYIAAVDKIGVAMGWNTVARIAMVHTGFNVVNTIVFLPLIGILVRTVTRLVPEKAHKETPHLTFLDVRMLDTPAIGIQQSAVEQMKMAEGVNKMMHFMRDIIDHDDDPDEKKERKVFHREEILDIMQKEIVEYLSDLLSGSIPHDVMEKAREHLRIADEYESISDYIAGILKLLLKLRNTNLRLTAEGKQEILALHAKVSEYLEMISEAVRLGNADVLSKARTMGDTITHIMKDDRQAHLARMEKVKMSPLKSLIYVDILQSYRKIKDHALNIAEAVAGEK